MALTLKRPSNDGGEAPPRKRTVSDSMIDEDSPGVFFRLNAQSVRECECSGHIVALSSVVSGGASQGRTRGDGRRGVHALLPQRRTQDNDNDDSEKCSTARDDCAERAVRSGDCRRCIVDMELSLFLSAVYVCASLAYLMDIRVRERRSSARRTCTGRCCDRSPPLCTVVSSWNNVASRYPRDPSRRRFYGNRSIGGDGEVDEACAAG